MVHYATLAGKGDVWHVMPHPPHQACSIAAECGHAHELQDILADAVVGSTRRLDAMVAVFCSERQPSDRASPIRPILAVSLHPGPSSPIRKARGGSFMKTYSRGLPLLRRNTMHPSRNPQLPLRRVALWAPVRFPRQGAEPCNSRGHHPLADASFEHLRGSPNNRSARDVPHERPPAFFSNSYYNPPASSYPYFCGAPDSPTFLVERWADSRCPTPPERAILTACCVEGYSRLRRHSAPG